MQLQDVTHLARPIAYPNGISWENRKGKHEQYYPISRPWSTIRPAIDGQSFETDIQDYQQATGPAVGEVYSPMIRWQLETVTDQAWNGVGEVAMKKGLDGSGSQQLDEADTRSINTV
jgi:hypothetical protein